MKIDLKGNTSQEGTPTLETPQDIHVVSGNNTIIVSNSDNTQSASYPISLGDIELCKIGTYQDKIFKNIPNTTDYDSNLEDNVWYSKKEIGKIESYNGETITTSYISTTGSLGTGATVYYGLNTPTYTEITDNTLISQLEAVKRSYGGQTNISQVNNDLPFTIKAKALIEF